MKKYLLFAIVLFNLFLVSPKALENSNIGTFIGEGRFYSLSPYPSVQNMGFQTNNSVSGNSDLWSAIPTTTNWTYGQNGGALVQCGMSFVKDFYYSVTYNFLISSSDNYLHPFYTSWVGHRVGILNTIDAKPSFEYDSVSAGVEMTKYLDNDYIGSFTVIFKAPQNGTCVSIAFSSSNRSTNPQHAPFVGYKYSSLGSAPLTESQIKNALSADVTDLKNRIDSMKDEQVKTNQKLDDLNSKQDKTNDTLTSEDEDTTSKKCGVVCKLKGIFTGIIELPKKIVEFLVDALKKLFVPTDDQLYEIVNDSKELSENFGFVGEAVAFFLNIFTGLLGMVNANGCVEMPAFKIGATSLFDEHVFWEARNVCLADNTILSANIDTIRAITSIAFVSLFLGFAASKFFGILSKNDSGTSMTYDENDNSFTVNDWSRTNGITYNRRYKS